MRAGLIGLFVWLAMAVVGTPVEAQTRPTAAEPTLADFLARANRIPQNAMAMVHPNRRRVQSEFQAALGVVAREQRDAREAGRQPAACMPDRVRLNPVEVLAFLNGLPPSRGSAPLSRGVQDWAAHAYPCPR